MAIQSKADFYALPYGNLLDSASDRAYKGGWGGTRVDEKSHSPSPSMLTATAGKAERLESLNPGRKAKRALVSYCGVEGHRSELHNF